MNTNIMDIQETIKDCPTWLNYEKGNFLLFTCVKVTRNFKNYVFSDKADISTKKTVNSKIERVLFEYIIRGELAKFNLDSLTDLEISVLSERKIIPPLAINKRAGIVLYIHKNLRTFILTNYLDHLNIYTFSNKSNIQNPYHENREILNLFSVEKFARNKKGDFLTANIDTFGTGMKVSMTLTVPYLRFFNKLFSLTHYLKQNGLTHRRLFGLGGDLDDCLIVFNSESYSLSENELLKKIDNFYIELEKLEHRYKDNFANKHLEHLKKKIDNIGTLESVSYKYFLDLYFSLQIGYDQELIDEQQFKLLTTGVIGFLRSNMVYKCYGENISNIDSYRMLQIKTILSK